MTTATAAIGNRTMETTGRSRRSLEELVDRVIDALFKVEPETAEPSAVQTIHEARRLRQARDVDDALTVLGGLDTARATTEEARWAYAEWVDLAKRRFGDSGAVVYRQGMGRAAVLVPRADGMLEVVAVLGCAGRPARRSPGAACGASGPCEAS